MKNRIHLSKARGKADSRVSENSQIFLDLEALDHAAVRSLIFHPRGDHRPALRSEQAREELFRVDENVSIGTCFYASAQSDPIVLFFHGNGEIARDYDDIAPLYTRLGINLLVADYRGYGRSGGEPTVSNMLRDSENLFEAVQSYLRTREFVGGLWVMGRSLGSAPALSVARAFGSNLNGLIVESGFADVAGLLNRLGVPVQRLPIRQRLPDINLQVIREVTIPTLIIHGEWDQIIPPTDGQALFAASPATRKEMIVIPKAGHNDLLWQGMQAYMGAIRRFIRDEEKPARPEAGS